MMGSLVKWVFVNKVILDKYAGTQVSYDGEDFLIVENDNILAIVE